MNTDLVEVTTTHKFWVDAADFGCQGNYSWCGADQAYEAIEGIDFMWADHKAPNPNQRTNCIALSLDKEKPGLTAEPWDTDKDVGFICESTGRAEHIAFLYSSFVILIKNEMKLLFLSGDQEPKSFLVTVSLINAR